MDAVSEADRDGHPGFGIYQFIPCFLVAETREIEAVRLPNN